MTVFISDLFIKRYLKGSDISSRSRLNTNTNELNMPTVSPDCNCSDLGKNMFLNRLQMTTSVTFGLVVSENSVMPKIMKDLIIREDRIVAQSRQDFQFCMYQECLLEVEYCHQYSTATIGDKYFAVFDFVSTEYKVLKLQFVEV